jgi:phosphogluconate dehydratase
MSVNSVISSVTEKIITRSKASRSRYLERIAQAKASQPSRKALGCANLAHGFAACGPGDKNELRNGTGPNLGIVTSFNDMLSAHQPFET